MNNDQRYKNKRLTIGYLFLGAGVVLFVLTLLLRNNTALDNYLKLIQGIGVFLVVGGIFIIIQSSVYKKNPAALKKDMIESLDERKIWIRHHAGNNAFLFCIATTYLVMLVVGRTNEPIDPELAWWVLAAMLCVTMVVYIVSLVIYEKKY